MKTCTSRLTLPSYVNSSKFKISLLALWLMLFFAANVTAQTICEPILQCTSMTVSCTDSAAQLSGDPGYTPLIIDSCNMDDIPERLMSVTWPIPYKNKCESDTSQIIMRMWNLPGGPTLCTDTVYVIRINLDSIVCAAGVDTINCGDGLN